MHNAWQAWRFNHIIEYRYYNPYRNSLQWIAIRWNEYRLTALNRVSREWISIHSIESLQSIVFHCSESRYTLSESTFTLVNRDSLKWIYINYSESRFNQMYWDLSKWIQIQQIVSSFSKLNPDSMIWNQLHDIPYILSVSRHSTQ